MEIDYIRVHDLNNQLIFSDEFDATADNEVVGQISWDVDGDGSVDALSDGVLILRGTFKLTGDNLVSGAISSESGISNEQVIENIANVEQIADIDGNGQVDALSDVLILLRYLFNFTSDDLIDGAVDEAAERTSASEIESYIESHMP